MKVTIDGVEYVPKEDGEESVLTVVDVFEKYRGTREYDGVVAVIQKWYYGSVVKAAWCATSMSWALAQLGLMKKTIGTKQENVYLFEKALENNLCQEVEYPDDAKAGDIIILNFSARWSITANKHVTAFTGQREGDVFYCIGGNQSDSIKVTGYNRTSIRSIWRPAYGTGGVKNLNHLPEV